MDASFEVGEIEQGRPPAGLVEAPRAEIGSFASEHRSAIRSVLLEHSAFWGERRVLAARVSELRRRP